MSSTRIRIARKTRDSLKQGKTTLSMLVTRAMNSYVEGRRTLPPAPDTDIVATTVTVDPRIVVAFTDLARKSGHTFDGAVRLAIEEELKDTKDRAGPSVSPATRFLR